MLFSYLFWNHEYDDNTSQFLLDSLSLWNQQLLLCFDQYLESKCMVRPDIIGIAIRLCQDEHVRIWKGFLYLVESGSEEISTVISDDFVVMVLIDRESRTKLLGWPNFHGERNNCLFFSFARPSNIREITLQYCTHCHCMSLVSEKHLR